MYILDTDHVSLFQRKHPIIIKRLNEIHPENLAITIITVEEQIKGRFKLIKQANSNAKLVRTYAALQSSVPIYAKGVNEKRRKPMETTNLTSNFIKPNRPLRPVKLYLALS